MKLYEVGQKIKEIRKEAGMTQEQLAVGVNISRVTLGKLERGQIGSVSIKTLDLILDKLDYEIELHKKSNNSFGLPSLNEIK